MCLFRTTVKGGGSTGPPAIEPRVEQTASLPKSQQLVQPGEQADVQFGATKKEDGPAAGKQSGPDSLKIPLNAAGGNQSAGQGGITV